MHAIVARTHHSEHFWKLPCRKSARRCGAKHISKSKCTKHLTVGPLLYRSQNVQNTPRPDHFWTFNRATLHNNDNNNNNKKKDNKDNKDNNNNNHNHNHNHNY